MTGFVLLYGTIVVVALASWVGNTWSRPTLLSARARLIRRNPYLAELNWDRASERTATRLVGVRAAVAVQSARRRVTVTLVALVSAATLVVPPVDDGYRSQHDYGLETAYGSAGLVV